MKAISREEIMYSNSLRYHFRACKKLYEVKINVEIVFLLEARKAF